MESHKPLGNVQQTFNASQQGTARLLVNDKGVVTYVADGRIAARIMEKQRKRARENVIANTKKLLSIQL